MCFWKRWSKSAADVPITVPEKPLFPDGFKILYDPEDATIDVCFVHGLTGDREGTWTAIGQSISWPQSLLPERLPKSRILTYGYDAYIARFTSSASSNTLIDHATNLLNDLAAVRTDEAQEYRPIIFVAHSLGGIVCKEALLLSRNNPESFLKPIFASTKGIMFMGTPHTGSWMADWALIPASALNVFKSTNTSLLRLLGTDNEFLEAVQRGFLEMVREVNGSGSGRKFEVICFFEELPMAVGKTVVSKESATFAGYNLLSIHADHSNMVRFSRADDNGFDRVIAVLRRWEKDIRLETIRIDQDIHLFKYPQTSVALITMGQKGSQLVATDKSAHDIFSCVGSPNDLFTGRAVVLNRMKAHLYPSENPSRLRWCVIHSIGGLGKTQTALEFAHQSRNSFNDVWWMQAENGPELAKNFAHIAQDKLSSDVANLQDQSRMIELVRRWLDETDRKCLLIFDNAENLRDLRTYWPTNPNISIVITTQKPDFLHAGVKEGRLSIALQALTSEEGASLLLKYLQNDPEYRRYGWDNSQFETASKISAMVEGSPLGIAQIAGYISQSRLELSTFLQIMRNRRNSSRVWSSSQPAYVWHYNKTLGDVHSIALSDLTPEASNAINIMSLFNPTAFNESFLFTQPLESNMPALGANETDFTFIEIIRSLLARHLVEKKQEGQVVKYSMHRSLQMDILHRLDLEPQTRQSAFDHVVGVMRATIPHRSKEYRPTPQHWSLWDDCLAHVISLSTIFDSSDPPISGSLPFATLLQNAGQYMWERSMTHAGPELLKAAERVLTTINLASNDVFWADIYTPIGLMMHFNGITSRAEGIQYLRKALSVREAHLASIANPSAQDLLIYWIAKMDLGWALLQSEAFDEASLIYEECLAWYKSQEPSEEPISFRFQYSKYYHNSSYVLMSRGETQRAIKHAERALELAVPDVSLTSQHGFMYRFTLGCHNLNSGQTKVAMELHRQILEDRIGILGTTNKDTLDSQYMMAVIYEGLGDTANAIKSLEAALLSAHIAKWDLEHTARAKYRLSLLLKARNEDPSRWQELDKEAGEIFSLLRSEIPEGMIKEDESPMVVYDYMASIWAGRTTGRLRTAALKGC